MSGIRRAVIALSAVLLAVVAPASALASALAATADDPALVDDLQWALERIGALDAWDRGTGDGVTIAVVDSGVDLTHEDLADKVDAHVSCVGAGGDPTKCQGSAQDDNGHGTHVSGVALAVTDNGLGVAGVAPDARLLAVRVLSNECTANGCSATGTAADVAAGIRWAADRGADVINLSLGGGALQATLGCAFCDAVEYAWSKGAIPVIAAGNDSVLAAGFADEPAIIVTATTRDDTRASYSNSSSDLLRAARWAVAAPGGEGEADASDCGPGGSPRGILSTYWIDGQSNAYACLAGTSMAAPQVSGALAILLSTGLRPQQAVDQLLATATDLGPAGRDPSFGSGRIDVARAVSSATVPPSSSTATTAPPATSAPPPVSSPTTVAPTVPTTTTPPPTTLGPPPTLPGTEQAAPFQAAARAEEGVPVWLVGLAVVALALSGAFTARTAWRLRTRADR